MDNKQGMDKEQLHKLAADFLQPLISGAQLQESSVTSSSRESLVALADPCTLHFKAKKSDPYRLVIRRSQPFEKISAGTVTEKDVVEAFVRVVNGMKNGLDSWYKADLRATFPRRVVAKALCNSTDEEEAMLTVIDQLSDWGGQQYEGKPIPAAIGFLPEKNQGAVSFRDVCCESFSAVISNGFDTLLTCNFKGQVIGHETLNPPDAVPEFAPYRMGAIAAWATDGKIALVLNRTSEILIFKDKQLRFVRRGGHWHFLTHAPVLTQMGRPDEHAVRQAVYETCLDASFARTGACIGVVISNHAQKWKTVAVCDNDHLKLEQSAKTKFLSPVVGEKKFQDLDRRLRQELVAVDGATLIDHTGTILAVGAILKIPGGSTGGGRLAAAKALSKLGLGIKVSQDGKITGYHDGKDEPKFMVM